MAECLECGDDDDFSRTRTLRIERSLHKEAHTSLTNEIHLLLASVPRAYIGSRRSAGKAEAPWEILTETVIELVSPLGLCDVQIAKFPVSGDNDHASLLVPRVLRLNRALFGVHRRKATSCGQLDQSCDQKP